MVLDRLIGSRLQHADPRVRAGAIARLAPDDALVLNAAVADEHADVRRAALERISDVETLGRAARLDADQTNRELAGRRLREVLTDGSLGDAEIGARASFLQVYGDAALAAFVLEHSTASRLRAAALPLVDDEELLGRVAIDDDSVEIRRAALARVSSTGALERIEHATRSSDHGVSRAARARLNALRGAEAGRATAESLCARMEGLAAGEGSTQDEAAFHHLEQEWQGLGAEAAGPELASRYDQARARFRELLAARAQERLQRAPLIGEREALLAELTAATTLDEALAARSAETLARTEAAWDAIAANDPAATQRFARAGAAIRERMGRLQHAQAQARPMRDLIAEVAAAGRARQVTPARLAALEARAQRVRRPADAELARTLDHDLGEGLERLRQRVRRETEAAAGAIEAIEPIVAAMESELERGDVALALKHHDEAQRLLHGIDAAAPAGKALRQRLHQAAPRLGELRDWQRWGVEQTRTNLCTEAEGLIGSADGPDQIARRVRALREEWRQLDRASGTTSKVLWERFDKACTAAYAPCAAHFAEQARTRAENLERKQSLLARLNALDAETDWNNADWRAAERAFHACEQEWRAVGPVDRALAKGLAEAHAEVRKRLAQRFDPRRESEVERRRALIAELTALAQSDELAGAAARVRDAQSRWPPILSARRSVEHALWNEFCAARDAVYERLRTARSASAQANQAALDVATSLCERAEALARELSGPAGTDAVSVAAFVENGRARLGALRAEQSQAPPLPEADGRRMGTRFRAALADAERALESHRNALARMGDETRAARERLCRELEQQIVTEGDAAGGEDWLARAREAWAAVSDASAPGNDALERRFMALCSAATSAAERAKLVERLQAQTEEKRRLCLRIEIVAGIESPPPYEAARRNYRAQWMQESMRGISRWPATDREKLEEARRIENEWQKLCAIPPSEDEALDERYRNALRALRGTTLAR